MIGALARKFFGSANDRRIKGYQGRVNAINALEPELEALSDEALKARTAEFRQQLADGKSLDDILVPAFATVREAAKRTLEQRHFDVQLIGGMVLHEGDIAEMKTGEGKTLVATLSVYLNALAGKGVHVVTVNDYLARRDAAGERVEIDRQRRHQRLAFAGLHLGDVALMQHDAADELDVEMALAEGALGGLADGGEGRNQDVVERLAFGELLAELLGAGFQRLVGEGGDLGLERIDGIDAGLIPLNPPVVGGAEKFAGERADHT